jgi:hypothetical protein
VATLTLIQCSEEDAGLQDALGVLQKLSKASQTREILWGSPNPHRQSGGPPTRAWIIQEGFLDEVDLDLEIANAGALTTINIFTVCSFMLEESKQDSLIRSTTKFINDLKGRIAQTTTTNDYRLFFPRFEELRPSSGFFQSIGCTNLIAIPEDREFPQTVAYPLSNTSGTDRFSWHMAGEILSLASLWKTMDGNLLFEAPPAVGGNPTAHLVRSFTRSAVSAYHSPDELLNAKSDLPAPEDFGRPPHPGKAIEECALGAYPDNFIAYEEPAFNPKKTVSGRQAIALITKRIISDLVHLPRTVKNGLQNELAAATDEIAQSLVGGQSWMQVGTGKTIGDSPTLPEGEGPTHDDVQARIRGIAASFADHSFTAPPEDWDQLLTATLGSIDGSKANEFHDENFVTVDRTKLIPTTGGNHLETSVESLGGFPQDLLIDYDAYQEVEEEAVEETTDEETSVDEEPGSEETVDEETSVDEEPGSEETVDEETSVDEEPGSEEEQPATLLNLISRRFASQRERSHEIAASSIERQLTLPSPYGHDFASSSRAVKYFFFCSFVLLFLAVGTLIRPVRELLAFEGFSAALRLKLFALLSAIIAIPVGLLFLPQKEAKARIYLIVLLAAIAGGLTIIILEAPRIGESIYGSELLSGTLSWLLTIAIVSSIIFAMVIGFRRTKSMTSGWAYLARRSLLILGPIYGIIMYLIGFNQVDPQWGFAKSVIGRDSLLFKVTVVVAIVAFLTSGIIVSVSKFQNEKRLDIYKAEQSYLEQKAQSAIYVRENLSQHHIEWLGTAAVLQRLIAHPFGDTETMGVRTASTPFGSEIILKYKTITLNLTKSGKEVFKSRAKPELSPPGWLTNSYRLASDSFINDPKANSEDDTLPEHCSFPWASAEESPLNEEFTYGRGTRWPFAHAFYNGEFDETLRSSADEKLKEIILEIFLDDPTSWKSEGTQNGTRGLSDIFSEILPSDEAATQFSMGMFGDHDARFKGTRDMTTAFAWPDNVELPTSAPAPTSIAKHQNINSSVIFQAIRVDISNSTDLAELGPDSPPSGPPDSPSGPPDSSSDNNSSLFGG